ncbi:MAG: type II secretion system F family protein [Planctomycetaceae bacterium]
MNAVRLALGRPEPSGQLALLWLMATACEKNLPLASAVDALANDAKGQWKFRLQDFAALVRRGTPVQQAIEKVPDLLPPDALLAARVGAASGNLGAALREEAERMAATQAEFETQSVLGAMVYTGAMITLLYLVLGFLMVWVIPKFKKIFQDFGAELPKLTLGLVEFCDGPGFLLLSPLALCAFSIPFLWLASVFGFRVNILNVRNFFPRMDTGPILRQLGVVVSGGKSLTDGLHAISTRHPNTSTWKRMSAVYEGVMAGEHPWVMMQDQKLLRRHERKLLESAERAGNLGWALKLLGRQIESRQDDAVRSVLALMRPLAVLAIGFVIGFAAVAMYIPLIKLVNDLS